MDSGLDRLASHLHVCSIRNPIGENTVFPSPFPFQADKSKWWSTNPSSSLFNYYLLIPNEEAFCVLLLRWLPYCADIEWRDGHCRNGTHHFKLMMQKRRKEEQQIVCEANPPERWTTQTSGEHNTISLSAIACTHRLTWCADDQLEEHACASVCIHISFIVRGQLTHGNHRRHHSRTHNR